MFKGYSSVVAMAIALLLCGCGAKDTVPPKVVSTSPPNGAEDVDPSLGQISVTFNEPMMDKSWSWCYEDKDRFPQMTNDPYYTENNTKCVLPVELVPNKEYVVWINTVNFKGFRDKAGNPADPHKFAFKTR